MTLTHKFAALGLGLLLVAAGCSSTPVENPPQGPGPISGEGPDAGSPADCSGLNTGPGNYDWTVQHDGLTRAFRVHVPPSYQASRFTPVVLGFHGLDNNPLSEEHTGQLSPLADEQGFIAVYPQGLSPRELGVVSLFPDQRSFNAGACCVDAMWNHVDDVGFVSDLLKHLSTRLCVDSHRVYSTGFSNGGLMSYRLACELADRIAAIAPVAGVDVTSSCAPSRPVPVMQFNGTLDVVIPYIGGIFSSAKSSVEDWAAHDQCQGDWQQTFHNGDSSCEALTQCSGGASVVLCTVQGGGHAWPGAPADGDGSGHITQDLNASREMWKFFQAHPRP